MDGGAATVAIEVLLQNLINATKEEISLIRGLEKNAENLKNTLAIIQGFLNDTGNKFISDEAVKRWLEELQGVAFDADNVLDELNYHLLSKKIKKEKKKKTSSFQQHMEPFCSFSISLVAILSVGVSCSNFEGDARR